MLAMSATEWKQDVLEAAGDKFERRLSEESSLIRLELAAMRVSIVRWMFAFWIANLTATLTIIEMLHRG
jgi:hypothetical protein